MELRGPVSPITLTASRRRLRPLPWLAASILRMMFIVFARTAAARISSSVSPSLVVIVDLRFVRPLERQRDGNYSGWPGIHRVRHPHADLGEHRDGAAHFVPSASLYGVP